VDFRGYAHDCRRYKNRLEEWRSPTNQNTRKEQEYIDYDDLKRRVAQKIPDGAIRDKKHSACK
jgi:hypothetical protein